MAQKGALGAFHSGITAAERAFAGGFVASDKICSDDAFDTRCLDDAASIATRETGDCVWPIMPANIDKCEITIARLCSNTTMNGDPFVAMAGAADYPCKDDPTFRPQRETACMGEQTDNPTAALTQRCVPVVDLACTKNPSYPAATPFRADLCYYKTDNAYIKARGLECIDDINNNGTEDPDAIMRRRI